MLVNDERRNNKKNASPRWNQAAENHRRSFAMIPPLSFHLPSLCGTPRRLISLAIVSCKALPTGEASLFRIFFQTFSSSIPWILPSVRTICLVHALKLSVSVSETRVYLVRPGLQLTKTEKNPARNSNATHGARGTNE